MPGNPEPTQTRAPTQREWLSLVPIGAGLWWLLAAHGWGWLVWTLLPGVLLLASGVSLLLWHEPGRQSMFTALGAALGLLGIPAMLTGSFGAALIGLLLSAASFIVAGRIALRYAAPVPDAPPPPQELKVYAKAALDEALVGYFVAMAKAPGGELAERMCLEAERLEEVLRGRGWLDDPAGFHKAPPAPESVRQTAAHTFPGIDYQRLRHPSGFIAEPQLPGADRWASHVRNRDCAAWMLRHDRPGRPWLLCIHGYRMGFPLVDLRLFEQKILHQKLGLNLLLPVLPLHGPRRRGWQSGDYYLDGDLLELLHAQSQALWDLRRSIAWIRSQDPNARIGVLGYSLGGYNAALLAAHEPGLDFVVAGIAVADFVPLVWGHVPAPHRAYYSARGLDAARLERLLRVVSPLACAPKLAPERLHLFAGSADRVVPPDQPLRLARHWGRSIEWYPGGHLTFRGERGVERCIEGAMLSAGWTLNGSVQSR